MTGVVKHKDYSIAGYNPIVEIQEMTVLEAAETLFKRAKDADGLFKAISGKLEKQRDLVIWWDGLGEKRGNKRNRPVTLPTIEDLGLDRMTMRRWRAKLKEPENYEKAIELAWEKCVRVCEAESTAHAGQASGQNEWYTPVEYIDAARLVMGEIDLDPASTPEANTVVGAGTIYTTEDNGLVQGWKGRVWMNPPYAKELIEKFVHKLLAEHSAGNVTEAIVLVNNATETYWFQSIGANCRAICFPSGRVKFWHPDRESAPLQGQAVLYLGDNVESFLGAYAGFGFVVVVK